MVLVIENIYKLADRASAKVLPHIKGAPKVNYTIGDVNTSSGYVSTDTGTSYSNTSSYQSPVETPSYTPTTTTTTDTTPSSGGGGDETVCPDCGAARESGAQFCGDCGHQYF